MRPQNEMAVSLHRDGFSHAEIATMLTPGASLADAPDPTPSAGASTTSCGATTTA